MEDIENLPFKVGDLFDFLSVKWKNNRAFDKSSDVSQIQTDEFSLPLVSSKHGNNGIMYYGRPEDFDSDEMTIEIISDGTLTVGEVYAQPQRTGILYNAYLIKPKTKVVTREILLYLTACLRKALAGKYSRSVKASWKNVSTEIIFLPAKNGIPDWNYMDSFIRSVEKERIQKLRSEMDVYKNKYMTALGIDDLDYTEQDFQIINGITNGNNYQNTDKFRMKPFELASFFSIQSTRGTDFDKVKFSENGEYDFIGRRVDNNGIQGTVDKLQYDPNPAQTFSLSQVGNCICFWRSREWYSSQNIFILLPKYQEISDVFLYFQTVINYGLKKYWNYYNRFPKIFDLEKQIIFVPVTPEGNIDFFSIREFVAAMKKIVVKNTLEQRNNLVSMVEELFR